MGGGGGGSELDRISIFRRGFWGRGGDFFPGMMGGRVEVLEVLVSKNLSCEIF